MLHRQTCTACEHEVGRTGLPVTCEIHRDSAPENYSQIEPLLCEVEALFADREFRDQLLQTYTARVESWKTGVVKA